MLNDGCKNPELESGGSDGPAGTLYKTAITNAAVTDRYILSDEAEQTYLPKYTFRGFRYAQITADEDIQIKKAVAKVYTSVGEETGFIETNDRDINQLFHNVQWGQMSNYLSIPADCPQRGERAGWTGDAQLFAATGVYTYDVYAFLESYNDILQEHAKQNNGAYGSIVPSAFVGFFADMVTSGWSDAGVVIPWVLYQQTGDKALIEKYYNQMDQYMDVVAKDGYNSEMFGDWLAFAGASTPYLNTVYQIYTTSLMLKMADILGKTSYVQKYEQRLLEQKTAFLKKYVDNKGNVLSSTADGVAESSHGYPVMDNAQTALLWALKLGLYQDDAQRSVMIQNLLANIKNEGGSVRPGYKEDTLSIGFLGINVILPVLTEIGTADTAYDLLLQDAIPSWLYSVKNGATTVWERWNSYSKENSFGDSSMNSFNHYSYGACVEWMFQYMGGISPDENAPGFQKIILQPTVDESGRITYVNSSYESVCGSIVSNWKTKGGRMSAYHAKVPANTSAILYLPITKAQAGMLKVPDGASFTGITERNGMNCAAYVLEAGSYDFDIPIVQDEAETFTSKKISIQSVKRKTGTSAKVTWTKADGADGYVVSYSEKQSFKGAKKVIVKGGSKTAKTVKNLRSGKKYYVRVRAYKMIDRKKAYTKYSRSFKM